MDSGVHDRLFRARARLRAAVETSHFPGALAPAAQRCLTDIDSALAGGFNIGGARLLLAQAAALLTVAQGPAVTSNGDADAHEK